MFSVEIKINGSMIAHIYGRNMGAANNTERHHFYRYKYYEPEDGILQEGLIVHQRENGIAPLVLEILKDVLERKDPEHGTVPSKEEVSCVTHDTGNSRRL